NPCTDVYAAGWIRIYVFTGSDSPPIEVRIQCYFHCDPAVSGTAQVELIACSRSAPIQPWPTPAADDGPSTSTPSDCVEKCVGWYRSGLRLQPSDLAHRFCAPYAKGFRAAYTTRFTGVGTPSCLPKSTTLPTSQGSSRRFPAARSTAIDGVQLSGTLAKNERQEAAASESRSVPAARPTAITSCIASSMSGSMSGSWRMGPIELRVRAQITPAPTRPTNFCHRSLLMLSDTVVSIPAALQAVSITFTLSEIVPSSSPNIIR